MSNKSYTKIKGMSREMKLAYFSAGRVTVGTISQVFDTDLKRFYVAKIRGVVVGNEDEYRHETPEAARKYGQKVLAQWRKEFTASQKVLNGEGK